MDFQTTFPAPTAAARRELRLGDHYPDPKDLEAQRAFHADFGGEIAAKVDLLLRLQRVNLAALPDERRRHIEQEARTIVHVLQGSLSQYAAVYGHTALEAFTDLIAEAVGAGEILCGGRLDYQFTYWTTGDLFSEPVVDTAV